MERGGWDVGEAEAEAVETHDSGATRCLRRLLRRRRLLRVRHSDRGTVRASNQDAFNRPPDLRLWRSPDGMGACAMAMCEPHGVHSLANTPIGAGLDEPNREVMVSSSR